MNKFKNYVLMAAGFAVLAAVISGITAAPAIALAVKAALVQSVDEPGRNPYQQTLSTVCPPTGECSLSFSKVPAGQRLVLTNVGGYTLTTKGLFPNVAVVPNNAAGTPTVWVIPTNIGFQTTAMEAIFNQSNQVYFEAGQQPTGVAYAGATDTLADFGMTLSGYYINLP